MINNQKLSQRLQMIADIVPKGVNLADIGADHGYLIQYLKVNDFINEAYASDNKKGPYERLKDNLKGIDIKVDLANGINRLPSYINCVCIAGMGGDTIISIFESDINKLKNVEYLVISAQSLNSEVREFLFKNNYKLISQNACFDIEPHYYEVDLYQKGLMEYDEIDIKYGRYLIKNHNLAFIENKENKIKKILELLKINSLPEEKILKLKAELDEYSKLLEIYKN